MDLDAFKQLAAEIAAQGYDEKTALHYAMLIGDIPISDQHGNIIVRDEKGHTVAWLKPLNMFLD